MHTLSRTAPRGSRLLGALTFGVLLAGGFTLSGAQGAPAYAHDQLIDAVVETSSSGGAAMKLTFSDNVLEVGTEIHVTDPEGSDAASSLPEFSGRDVTQAIETPLVDGDYVTAWRVVSSDGHPIEGALTFEVSNGAAGDVRQYSPEAEQPTDTPDTTGNADTSEGGTSALPLAIGGAAVLAVIVAAIPMLMRMRKNARPEEPTELPNPKE